MNELKNLTDEELICYYKLYKYELEKSKRFELCKIYKYDTKYAMHLFRLCLQCEDVLQTGDLDLQRHRKHLKAVRRGQYTESEVQDWFSNKERQLEELYINCTALPRSPNEEVIKKLLFECLEMHYGSLSDCIKLSNLDVNVILDEIDFNIVKLRRNLNERRTN